MKFVNVLNSSLENLLSENPNVFILGEDILDPYGGAFKVTKGLSDKYPNNVITTPISEASIVGMATGMSMRGLLPVVEIMFGDFLGLAFDQILNHASKFNYMYDGKVSPRIMIRTPMGGRRGYGPTHSQSLEKYFIGIPDFKVISPSIFCNTSELLRHAVLNDPSPKLFVEHKLLYTQEIPLVENGYLDSFIIEFLDSEEYPTVQMSISPLEDCELTILAYGYMAGIVKEIIMELMIEEELSCSLIVPSLLSPFKYSLLSQSLNATGRLLIVEEGTLRNGFGAEIAAVVQESFFQKLKAPVKRLASLDSTIPSSKNLENEVLVSNDFIREQIKQMLTKV